MPLPPLLNSQGFFSTELGLKAELVAEWGMDEEQLGLEAELIWGRRGNEGRAGPGGGAGLVAEWVWRWSWSGDRAELEAWHSLPVVHPSWGLALAPPHAPRQRGPPHSLRTTALLFL